VKQGNKRIAGICTLFVLTLASAAVCAWAVTRYVGESRGRYALYAIGLAALIYIIIEAVNSARFIKHKAKKVGGSRESAAAALVLMNENAEEVGFWDLRGRAGLVIGRGGDDIQPDIDLSGTEYFSAVSAEHAVLNYASGNWYLADVGSKNGTALSRGESGQKMLLAPGDPVPIRPGDTIYIAEETILSVR
jgi:hypothetical protein